MKWCGTCISFCVHTFRKIRAKRRHAKEELKAKRLKRRMIQKRLRMEQRQHKKKLLHKKRLKQQHNKNRSADNFLDKVAVALKHREDDKWFIMGLKFLGRVIYYGCLHCIHLAGGFCYRVFRGIQTLCRKTYWGIRFVYTKAYWTIRGLFQKIYWRTRTTVEKIYWKTRTTGQRLYWFYYVQSRKLYQNLTRNIYMDLFFVFLRGHLKKQKVMLNCLKILGIREYIRQYEETAPYEILEKSMERTVCIPEFFERTPERLEHFPSPDIYIAKLSDISLIGGSNAVIAPHAFLNDTAYYDGGKRIDIRYSVIRTVINGVAIIEDSEETAEIEKGINLVGAASFNYYHLVVEILSRLTFVDTKPEYRDYPVLVDEVVLNIPQFHAALDCVNKYGHSLIEIKKGQKYRVGSLVLPSSNVWMPTNLYNRDMIRADDFLISKTVLDNIRSAVGVVCDGKADRKIFISRKNTQAVRLKNEETIRNIFAQKGFEIVFAEEMTFRQQVECFGRAKCVIAASGAALTNIIFCRPGTIVGCIIPSYHRFYMYSTIAHLLGLYPVFLDAEITELTPYAAADTFVLDTDYTERYIDFLKKYEI